VTVTATDSVGLAVTGSVDLVLDNSGAVVIALDLDDEDLILNTDAVILATVEDDDNIIQAAEYYVDVVGLPGEGVAMSPVDGAFDSLVEDVSAPLSIAALDEGQHTVFVRAQDVTGVWGPPQGLDFVVDRIPPAIQVVEVTYPKNQTRARDTQTLLFSALVTDATAGLNTDLVLLTVPDVNEDVVNARMHDDGTNGDFVAGDDVYTLAVEVTSGETGEFSFTIGATDIVPNSSSREGKVLLDNEVPELAVQVAPVPKNGEGLTGEVYQSEVILSGEYRDHPDADFLSVIAIQVRNSAGIDVNNSPFLLPPAEDRAFSRVLSLVEGLNAVTVAVFDGVGNVTTETFELTYIPPKETEIVDSSGGTVTAPDGTSVEIPAKALLEPEEISVRRIRTADLPKPVDDDVEVLANAHRFGPEGIVFHKPVTITLAYSDADLDTDQDGNPDFDESALSAFFWDGFTWIKIEADDRSTSENYVRFMTNHFSIYALGVDSAPDDFEMYWTRNPFAVTEGTTAVMKLPSSGQISLKVYDLEGDLVRTISELEQISGTTNRSWDGTNDFDAYVGSGIYIYLFEYVDGSGVKKVIRKPIGVVE